MKINVVAIGKIKEDFLKNGIAEYQKRMTRFSDFNIIEFNEAPPSKSESEQIAFECAEILPKLKGVVIATDIDGKQLSSVELSRFIDEKAVGGASEFTFVIGGSFGLDKKIKDMAALRLSFSKMTFPHQLFRLMLCEQIYRALTISNRLPYHK